MLPFLHLNIRLELGCRIGLSEPPQAFSLPWQKDAGGRRGSEEDSGGAAGQAAAVHHVCAHTQFVIYQFT